jgi:hypothetical protein
MELEHQPRRRAIDHSNREARRAVADVIDRFTRWRVAIANMSGRAELGRLTAVDRERMLKDCMEIENEIAEARTDLLLELADAPVKVTSHSRVVDAERALDNVEVSLAGVRRLIAQEH